MPALESETQILSIHNIESGIETLDKFAYENDPKLKEGKLHLTRRLELSWTPAHVGKKDGFFALKLIRQNEILALKLKWPWSSMGRMEWEPYSLRGSMESQP